MTITAFSWLTELCALIYIVGLAVCAWAYRESQKPGYFVVGVYFAFTFCTLIVLPAINNARYKAWQVQQPPIQAHTADRSDTIASAPPLSPVVIPPRLLAVRFPVGPILLVTGLCLLARRERKQVEPSAGGNAAPPRASA